MLYLTGCAEANLPAAEQARGVYEYLFDALREAHAQPVQERIYGSLSARAAVLAQRQTVSQDFGLASFLPPTYIEGAPCEGEGLAGVHVLAVATGAGDHPFALADVTWQGHCCGRKVERSGAQHLYLADVAAHVGKPDAGSSRADHAWAVFEAAGQVLAAHDLSFTDVVRTWVYLDDILSWYDDFNEVRNGFYRRVGLLTEEAPTFLPASTGIAGRNPWGLGCTLDLLAVRRAATDRPRIWAVSNPRQSEAYAYKSSFSRGACMAEEDVTRIYVSGTAAIDREGRSVHQGDLDAQTEFTLRNVESLLAQADAGFDDLVHATVFFKPGSDPAALSRALERTGLASFPAVTVQADICREDLLFEMDAEAAVTTTGW